MKTKDGLKDPWSLPFLRWSHWNLICSRGSTGSKAQKKGLDLTCHAILFPCVFSINLNIKVHRMRGLLCRKHCEKKLWPFLCLHLLSFDGKMWKQFFTLKITNWWFRVSINASLHPRDAEYIQHQVKKYTCKIFPIYVNQFYVKLSIFFLSSIFLSLFHKQSVIPWVMTLAHASFVLAIIKVFTKYSFQK